MVVGYALSVAYVLVSELAVGFTLAATALAAWRRPPDLGLAFVLAAAYTNAILILT